MLDLKSQLDLFTVPDREKLFDLSIGAYLVNPLKDHYPYEDIAKEYLDQLIPGRAELFGKDPLEKAKENGEVFAKWGLLSGLCGGSGSGTSSREAERNGR